jgi:hypothetical protein
MLIGYARCSTGAQDLTAQRDALTALGVQPDRIYADHGLTGTNRARPGLREALAACRAGDTLVVTKLDRLARSLPDARDIVEELTEADVKLNIGGSIHDPADPVGRLLRQYAAVLRGELTGTRADELLTDVGSRRVASADLDAIAKDLESWAERDWVAVIDIGPEREHLAGPLPPFPGPAGR